MAWLYGIAFILVAALVIVAGAYIFVYQRETAPKPAPKPEKKMEP